MTPRQFIIVYQPERTRQKGSFSMGQAVDGGILCVSPDKAIFHKIGFDGLDRAHYSRIARREKADQRHHQNAGVEVFASVILHEGIHVRIKTLAANLLMDRRSKFFPSCDIDRE